ncbi:alpha/beta hydrolase, partial [Candidatus Poribacteria bacterium]|nr:alpha/beta hydrolase [Candidatus Poribacteria bacterium]
MSAIALPMLLALGVSAAAPAPLYDRIEHAYADNDSVRIHYVSIGDGPLVIMIHGFPDYW